MASKLLFILGLSLMVSSVVRSEPINPPTRQKVQTFINLLDYIKKDYPNAVKDGKIISTSEYQEMQEFSKRIALLHEELSPTLKNETFSSLKSSVKKLSKAVQQKASKEKIAEIAGVIRNKVLALHLISVTPPSWPSIAKGKQLFTTRCKSCHGPNGAGNGPLADQLDPTPTNFQDSSVAADLSPLQAYNTIRLGIDGTAMRPFKELSDQQAWNIAFYINSLTYQDSLTASRREQITKVLQDTLGLEALATIPNKKWKSYFDSLGINSRQGMAVLRSAHQPENANRDLLAQAIKLLKKSEKSYRTGNADEARKFALNAYLNGVEPREAQIKATEPSLVNQIENDMFTVRSDIKKGVSVAVLEGHIQKATASLQQAQQMLREQDYSFWFTYIVSASILLREGLEAFLIIMIILGVLRSVDAGKSIKYVHAGWFVALILGIMSWFFTEQLIALGSFNREMMEGLGSLIAVGMLLYIGFWLHNKTYASQWTKFVKEKIHRLLNENNHWGLAVLAFVVVFREAFESVIFLSSISLKSADAGNSGILLGSMSAIIVVLLLGVVFMKISKNIPIQRLFQYSSLVMAILAVILVGQGIHEFQEAGYLSIQSIPVHFNLPVLGIYPTVQTVIAQILIIGSVLGLWYYSRQMALRSKAE